MAVVAFLWWFFFVQLCAKKSVYIATAIISISLLMVSLLAASNEYLKSMVSLFTTDINATLFLVTICLAVIVYMGTLITIKDKSAREKIKVPGLFFLLGIFFGVLVNKLEPCILSGFYNSYCASHASLPPFFMNKLSIISLVSIALVFLVASWKILHMNYGTPRNQ
jgi:hypothetical protein